jgi:membrane protease YdiL (CAAX protease family)
MLSSEFYSLAAYSLLAVAILSLWLHRSFSIWGSLLGLASFFAILANRLTLPGVLFVIGFLVIVHQYYGPRKKRRGLFGLLVMGLGLGLGAHFLPGFRNWKVIEEVVTPGALPVQLYLNFDKTWVGLALLGFGSIELCGPRNFGAVLKKSLPLMVLTCVVLLGVAFGVHAVTLDLKWPRFAPLWLSVNLLFVCVAEEAFFRGFLQKELGLFFEKRRFGKGLFSGKKKNGVTPGQILGWILASLLFGLAHYRGGLVYVAVSTLAGFFYGAAFLRTKRIEASILSHFMVNAIHFLAFSYPFRG